MAELVGTNQISTFTTPAEGAQILSATHRTNYNTIKSAFNTHEADGGLHVQSGAVAGRPAFGTAGRKWLATDSGGKFLTYDTGSAWADIDYLKLTGGTVTGAVTVSSGGINVTGNSVITGTLTGVTTMAGTLTTAAQTNVTSVGTLTGLAVAGGVTVTTAKATLAATAAGYASLNLPHGTAPSTPANGDLWTTTTGLYARINSATQGPFASKVTAFGVFEGDVPAADGVIPFDTELFDAAGFHDNVTNNHRFIVPSGYDGTYVFHLHVNYSTSNTSVAGNKNSDAYGFATYGLVGNGVGNAPIDYTVVVTLAAGDYVSFYAAKGGVETPECRLTMWRLW